MVVSDTRSFGQQRKQNLIFFAVKNNNPDSERLDHKKMATGPLAILGYLVRSGMWSREDSLLRFKRVVVDVESTVAYLHRHCVDNHLRRQKAALSNNRSPDLYAATLVNYTEFSGYVKQLLDYFADHNIEPILVYEGKLMEAPLYGLLAARFDWNTRRVVESVAAIANYNKTGQQIAADQLAAPSLALIIFKMIVNVQRRAGARIKVRQAFYSAYPQMAKMARDYQCPVLTNRGDFIIMDVRAGFLLFDEFWFQHVELHGLISGQDSKSESLSGQAKTKTPKSPKSRVKLSKSPRDGAGKGVTSKFHQSYLFYHQHPGLNAELAMNLYPLTSKDFSIKYVKSLKRLQIYDPHYGDRELKPEPKLNPIKKTYKQHHLSANRLDMVLRFLSSKTLDILGNLVRGEATRLNSSFDVDYRNLFNYYAVAYEFKQRLRFTLKYILDPLQLNYIEWCLINRECTPDHLLGLLCCSVGRMACVSYNRCLQMEDLETNRSAYWLMNRGKTMLMSLLSENKSRKSEHSLSLSSKQPDTITRYAEAALTTVDRERGELIEHTLHTYHEDTRLDAIRNKLQLTKLARRQVDVQHRREFINLVFRAPNLTALPNKMETVVTKLLANDEHNLKTEFAILRSLFHYSFASASAEDNHFKSAYTDLSHHFETALVNAYLYTNARLSKAAASGNLPALVDLVHKKNFENVATVQQETSNTGSQTSSPVDGRKKKDRNVTKRIRHLIELLNASIESYCELNAFLEYPTSSINLYVHYNPILLFNLTMYSLNHADNKVLIKF